jgi:hypothetical protein
MGITDICIFDNVSYYHESSNRKEWRWWQKWWGKEGKDGEKERMGSNEEEWKRIKMTYSLFRYGNVAVKCTERFYKHPTVLLFATFKRTHTKLPF